MSSSWDEVYKKFNSKFGDDTVTIDSTFSNVRQIENRMKTLTQQFRKLHRSTNELRTLRDSMQLPSSASPPPPPPPPPRQKVVEFEPVLSKGNRALRGQVIEISSSKARMYDQKFEQFLLEFRKKFGKNS